MGCRFSTRQFGSVSRAATHPSLITFCARHPDWQLFPNSQTPQVSPFSEARMERTWLRKDDCSHTSRNVLVITDPNLSPLKRTFLNASHGKISPRWLMISTSWAALQGVLPIPRILKG